MNYTLKTTEEYEKQNVLIVAAKRLFPLIAEEKGKVFGAFFAMTINSATTLIAPVIIAHTIDTYIRQKDMHGVLINSGLLLVLFCIGGIASYLQTITMGGVGRRALFRLRNRLFNHLQLLPVAFFNQNKAGDVISRINSDTEKLNNFFAQALIQFLANLFLIVGAGIFLVSLHLQLGLVALIPALGILIITKILSPWVNRSNVKSLQTLGTMTGEIQESLANFRAIAAFSRLDYFRDSFQVANDRNYDSSVVAGVANTLFTPIYGLCTSIAQLLTLLTGIYFILHGQATVGLLVAFLLYVNNFYAPLRQLAAIWTTWQTALAGLDRISELLAMKSDMDIIPSSESASGTLLEMKNVAFAYPDGETVLHDVSLELQAGKTYALVGPTGGGKTTTASLMARLYDPVKGEVLLKGKDIRSYDPVQRTMIIGFIVQDPYLFTGTVWENIIYANERFVDYSIDQVREVVEREGLSKLLDRFDQGLETPISEGGDTLSLGQKQLIAFMRAVLRHPELLILDEATANIDTITEQLLEDILKKLPATTTKVIIAHRLNTIEDADEIFFVGGGIITRAGSMQHAVEMLMHGDNRKS
ncbi:MAG TPA: ABC transporter ATP-binding protein [Candidatus Andersenbacteria bacterium]|nr:ABC transporter ATP-binding protein [Candidatus Andersenbacteria bacterium]